MFVGRFAREGALTTETLQRESSERLAVHIECSLPAAVELVLGWSTDL